MTNTFLSSLAIFSFVCFSGAIGTDDGHRITVTSYYILMSYILLKLLIEIESYLLKCTPFMRKTTFDVVCKKYHLRIDYINRMHFYHSTIL